MTEKYDSKATILIGREEEAGNSLSNVFTLCLDGSMIYSFKTSEDDGHGYLPNCASAAEEISRQMIRKGVKEYSVENGKRYNRGEVIQSKAIPPDGISVFKNTLDTKLSYAKAYV